MATACGRPCPESSSLRKPKILKQGHDEGLKIK
jgi:hypothetical protein